MAEYVMANRRAGKFHESQKQASRAAFGMALNTLSAGIDIENDNEPADQESRRIVVFQAEPNEIEILGRDLPDDVILEPRIDHWPTSMVPLQFQIGDVSPSDAAPFPTGTGNKIRIDVVGAGNALAGADVIVFFRAFGDLTTSDRRTTPANGRVTFSYSDVWVPQTAIVVPAGDHWVMVHFGPSGNLTIECPPLPKTGPLAWWHNAMGVNRASNSRGAGISVGVCDTGIGPHGDLAHATDIGAFINNVHLPNDGADVDSHGSHVCGTIGARPDQNSGSFQGIASGVDLFSARVFPSPDKGASNADIANAIDALSIDHQVDLINLSLGASQGSAIVQDVMQDARERGTLCVCAAGNSDGPVEFPGAFPEGAAVAALGQIGWGPIGSMASLRLPSTSDRIGDQNLYHANFSCFGDEITCAAPGVGYISTVPERFGLTLPYAPMGGTSMASPATCGLLAAILAESDAYTATNRDFTRSSMALSLLKQHSVDIGMQAKFQGAGIPVL